MAEGRFVALLTIAMLPRLAGMEREDLGRNVGFLVHDVARLLRVHFDRRARSLGLTRSQWWVLTHLYRNAGMTQTQLAEILEVERATLGRILDRLEEKGWVRRDGDDADRRIKRVWLTGGVDELMRELRRTAAEVRADALAGLPPGEVDALVATLLQMKQNLAGSGGGQATDD